MYSVYCDSPKTFFSTDSPIHIFDENKNSFYFHPNVEGRINFNLPVGKFYTDNKLIEREFSPYENFKGYNFKISPSEFHIVEADNEHKATISPDERIITIDKKISKLKYKPAIVFLIGHECGHLKHGGNKFDVYGNLTFDAEKECDCFSEIYMLSHGYNPTQITIAKQLLLAPNSHRLNCTYKPNYRR